MGALEDRLLSRRQIVGDHWIYSPTTIRGYGQAIQIGSRTDGSRRKILPHRLAWMLWVGEIPEGWHIHHLCGERACFNPDHLSAQSATDHHREHKAPGERCCRGHRLDDPDNVYVRPNGTRLCRACRKLRGR